MKRWVHLEHNQRLYQESPREKTCYKMQWRSCSHQEMSEKNMSQTCLGIGGRPLQAQTFFSHLFLSKHEHSSRCWLKTGIDRAPLQEYWSSSSLLMVKDHIIAGFTTWKPKQIQWWYIEAIHGKDKAIAVKSRADL